MHGGHVLGYLCGLDCRVQIYIVMIYILEGILLLEYSSFNDGLSLIIYRFKYEVELVQEI